MPRVITVLRDCAIEFFSPTDVVYKMRGGRRVKRETSLIGSLLFCRAPERHLVETVNTPGLPLIFYYPRIKPTDGNSRRVVVDDAEMERFIKFATTDYLHPRLLTIEEANEEMYGGKVIRFTQGIFAGQEAIVSTKRHHRRRIVVTLANCMALTVEMPRAEG